MRILRIVMAVLLTLGLTLSPVAAGIVQKQMVKCDHEQTMGDAQVMAMQQDDCPCCKSRADCPRSFCAAYSAGPQAVLTTDTGLLNRLRQKLDAEPSPILRWLTLAPDPPPPRHLMDL